MGGKPIIHKRTNIDIYIHKVVRYKKVKIDVARDILRFVQKAMITVNEFLEQAGAPRRRTFHPFPCQGRF